MADDLESWAIEQARHISLGGACRCNESGACAVHLDIAEEMQAQRAMGVRIGRRERETEIVAWSDRQVALLRADGSTILDAAWLAAYQQIGEDIKRGAGRKEGV